MEIVKAINNSNVLIIAESYFKSYTSPLPFMEEQSSIAVRVGFQTGLPQFNLPDLIEVRNPLNVDINSNEVSEVLDIIKNSKYEYVICIGRKPVMWFFNSLSKGRTMEEMTNSPLLNPSEFPNLKVGVLPHYKTAFAKDSEDALTDYWDKFKALFSDRPKYNATDTKINTEEEFCQLLDFLDSLPKDTLIGLDYETNAVDQFNKDFAVTMYGLAYLVDQHNANGFWYHPPKNKPLSEKAMKRWEKFLDDNYNRIWAYNCGFEIKTTWDQVGKMYRMQDAMVLMTVQGKRGSLKNVARTELGTSIWESSVHNFMEITDAMFKYTKRSKNRDIIEGMFKQHDIQGLRQFHANYDKWFNQILEDYEESDLIHALDNYPHVWATVPPHVLGPYCAKDAGLALLLVANFNDPEYKQAYDFCIYHPWLAVKFEVNGAPWNDKEAERLEKEMGQQMLDHLYNVIVNLNTITDEERMLAIETYNRDLPYEVISYTEKTKKERRTLIETNYDKVEQLKTIFNPGSNTEESRKKFWDSYLTNDIILGTIMNIFIEDMEFNQSLKPLYDVIGKDYVTNHTVQEIVAKFSEPELFLTDKNLIEQCKRSLLKATKEYKDHLGKFATDLVKNQYQVHSRWLGLDIDNKETWSKEFQLLFDLFMYKKISKTVSSNINGKTGRALVTEVVGEKWGKPLRGRAFSEKEKDESWADVECVLNSTFNTLSADTLRWSSSIHTIPSGSEIRKVLKPKNKDEVMLHCLKGDTLICTNKGNIPIEELVYRFNQGEKFTVKARKSDKLKHEAKVQPITRAFESKKVFETIKLTFENGRSVECTPDHKFLTTEGVWIEAKDIDENTELMESASERKRKLEEYVKNGGTMNARDPFYPLDTVAKERFCRCCNSWLSNKVFMQHIVNDHSLSFKEYCYKFNKNLEPENLHICPYCDSGKLVGYFVKDNNGSILKLCNKTKECYANFKSSIFRDKYANDPDFRKFHEERGKSFFIEYLNNNPQEREKRSQLTSARMKKFWKTDEFKNKVIRGVKSAFTNELAPLNFIRTSRKHTRVLPYSRKYDYSHLYVVQLSNEIIKIGIFYENKTRRMDELKSSSDNFKLIRLVKFKGTVAFDVETELLYFTWKDFITYAKFKSTETRSIKCLDSLIKHLDLVLTSYFYVNSDGYYVEKSENQLYLDTNNKADNEWKKLKNENNI